MFNKNKFLESRNKTIIWTGNSIYPEKMVIQKHTCTPMFTEAIFAIVRTWEEPTCPVTGEWIKKLWCIYTMEYDSTIKRTKLVNNGDVDEARICHTEWSQKNKISRRSSWPRDWTQVSRSVGRHFAVWATREVAVSETQVQSLGWEICWRRKQQPTPLFLPGKYHGQRSQASYSPWGCKESDMT